MDDSAVVFWAVVREKEEQKKQMKWCELSR